MYGQRLELTQSQKLMMTPMMQQAVMLLQMSSLELEQHIQQEMIENPLLEDRNEAQDPDVNPQEISSETDVPADDEKKESLHKEAEKIEQDIEKEKSRAEEAEQAESEGADFDWQQFFADQNDSYQPAREMDKERPSMEALLTGAVSLEEHLIRQVRLTTSDDEDLLAASLICSNLTEDGYLALPLGELGKNTSLPLEILEGMRQRIQRMDPIGVASKDLRECLLVQLKERGEKSSWAWRIVDECMEDLEKNRLPQIAKKLNIRIEEVKAAVEEIQSLEPRPGRQFDKVEVKYVTPDVIVDKMDSEYIITLNEDWMPRLRISPYYWQLYKKLKQQREKGEIRDFLKNKLNSALWLIKSIDQRQSTIYKVSEAIVRYQKDFLDYGIKFLRPLTLKQIADDIEMHESTVSRVTTNKYIQTPRGTFELKYFFSSSIETEVGEDASSRSIKAIIREIVEAEDPQRPLSDQRITDILQKRGFNLARRTVTKYRKQLNLLPASQRRQY